MSKPKTLAVVSDKGEATDETLTFTPRIGEFSCPCGGKAQTGETRHGTTLIHTHPPCQNFTDLEPHEYVRWVRLNGGEVLN